MKTLKLHLETLTPIWTGNIEGETDHLHETGIIGSLRWWYEAIIRGLGGEACDPTTHTCPDKKGNRCDACDLFGTTGWQRRFRLEIEDHTSQVWEPPPNILNIKPNNRNRGWYLPPGRIGNFNIQIISTPSILEQLAALFLFLEKWGSLGAKSQLGYGIFRITNREKIFEKAREWRWHSLGTNENHQTLPDLRRFSFFQFSAQEESQNWWEDVDGLRRLLKHGKYASAFNRIVEQDMIPISPILKNVFRFYRWQGSNSNKNYLLGTSQGRYHVRSKFMTSWAYREAGEWRIKGSVWFPIQDDKGRSIQKSTLQNIWATIRDINMWRNTLKMNSGTITTLPDIANWQTQTMDEVVQILENAKEAIQ